MEVETYILLAQELATFKTMRVRIYSLAPQRLERFSTVY
jgi:hypothetical protein